MISCKCFSASFICVAMCLGNAFLWAAPIHGGQFREVAWGDLHYNLDVGTDEKAPHVRQIAAGDFHSLALLRDGEVIAWGDNTFGQTDIPAILSHRHVVEIAAGNIHSMALLHNGRVVAWGPIGGVYGDFGQCNVPANLKGVVAIAAGAVHSVALRDNGTVVAWGLNLNGQCNAPRGLNNVVAIAAGMQHTIALKADGTVVAWGESRL